MAERGGFEPPRAHNDDGAEEFNVIDISKLKTVVAETAVSREVPPSTRQFPQKPKRFRPLNGERTEQTTARVKSLTTVQRFASIASTSVVTNAFQINGHN
jgi:hypothetical protein